MRPSEQSDLKEGNDYPTTLNPIDHEYYDLVLKMVLWGESRDDVYQRLAPNGVSGGIADRLYERAMADRIRTIRAEYSRKLLIGSALIVAAVVIFSLCWFGLHFIPRILFYACFAALGIGWWKFINGLSGYLMAASKTGSVSDDI